MLFSLPNVENMIPDLPGWITFPTHHCWSTDPLLMPSHTGAFTLFHQILVPCSHEHMVGLACNHLAKAIQHSNGGAGCVPLTQRTILMCSAFSRASSRRSNLFLNKETNQQTSTGIHRNLEVFMASWSVSSVFKVLC